MEYDHAKQRLIQAWGTLGSSWGVNRTMAQIHALLMISPEPLSADEVMEELNISRGNANMNIRALIDWGMVYKEFKPGERREYFRSEKDVWDLARQVARERRKRELEPILKALNEVSKVEGADSEKVKEMNKMVKDLKEFAEKSDGLLDKFIKSDEHWFFGNILKLIK
ncbi:MAG: MarR family transcriptional regulator [Bacteroidota bacterium]